MTWPIIDGVSLLHLHTHRGKRSIALNLKTDDGLNIYKELVSSADAVVEAMRPGTLEKLGLGFDVLKEINPELSFVPYRGTDPLAHIKICPVMELLTIPGLG